MSEINFIQNMLVITNKVSLASIMKIISEEDY